MKCALALRLLRALQSVSYPGGDDFNLRGLNGRLVAKNPGKTNPMVMAIKSTQFMRYFSLWSGGILGLTPEEFKGHYGSQSGRIGFASAASNAGIPVELWDRHDDWASLALPFDTRDDESTSTTFDVLDDSIPIVEGVPSNTFRWLAELS